MDQHHSLAVVLLLAFAAAGAVADYAGYDNCIAKAEKKFQATVSKAAAALAAQSTTCAALQPASSAPGDVEAASNGDVTVAAAQPAAPKRPSCPKACQYGLCLARCYIDRISLYPDGCKVYDCLPGCTKSINFKCATGRLG